MVDAPESDDLKLLDDTERTLYVRGVFRVIGASRAVIWTNKKAGIILMCLNFICITS